MNAISALAQFISRRLLFLGKCSVHRFADPVYGVEYSLKDFFAQSRVGSSSTKSFQKSSPTRSWSARSPRIANWRAFWCDQNQCCVFRLVPVESGALELVLGAAERINRLVRNDADRNPAGRAIFGIKRSLPAMASRYFVWFMERSPPPALEPPPAAPESRVSR